MSSGAAIDTRDNPSHNNPSRLYWAVPYLFAFFTIFIMLPFIFKSDSPFASTLPYLYLAIVPFALDIIFGRETRDAVGVEHDMFFDRIAWGLIPLHYVIFIASVFIYAHKDWPIWAMIVFAAGLGFMNGNVITLGHEVGHRHDKANQRWADIALGLVGYEHFTLAHNRGHHVKVATPEDTASARLGENAYVFALRDIFGNIRSAWDFEAARLSKKDLPALHWRNEILQVNGATVIMTAALTYIFGWKVLPFIILHHLFSWFALSLVNYLEHYGLRRQKRENGKYEPCRPRHSWNSNHKMSNLLTLNLQRHSDHHTKPSKPYQSLIDETDAPQLPAGYPPCILMALIPPLWRAVMDPKVMDWAEGDLSKTNLCPRAARKYEKRYRLGT